jgi:hypothetical protein
MIYSDAELPEVKPFCRHKPAGEILSLTAKDLSSPGLVSEKNARAT